MLELFLMSKNRVIDPEDVYGDITGPERRPVLVRDILRVGDNIRNLSNDELCGTSKGIYATDNVLLELAYNSAPWTEGHEWMSEKNEPLLNEIMNDLSPLDVDNNNPEAWAKLKADIEKLRLEESNRKNT